MHDRDNNFDALRLGAACSVMLTHAFLIGEGRIDIDPLMRLTGGQCPLGVAGVFVFFIISGFLVSQSLEATANVPRFLMKRALRIYPGLALCLVLLAFVLGPAATALAPGAYFADPGTYGYVGANLLMDANWNGLPGVRFTGFDAGAVIDGPLWSLPCEVVMYLMLATLGLARMVRWSVIGGLFALGLVCVALDTASWDMALGGALWLLPFFVAGMALHKFRARFVLDWRWALAALAGLIVGAALGRFIMAFAAFGSYLVIYAALAGSRHFRAARWGDLSYGLYIYGWPVEQGVTRALGGAAPWWEVLVLSLPAAAALAFVSWHAVEAPALRLKPGRRAAAVAAAADA